MKDWRAYLGSGLIKEVRPNFRQIERQVLRAEKDLRTDNNTKLLSRSRAGCSAKKMAWLSSISTA